MKESVIRNSMLGAFFFSQIWVAKGFSLAMRLLKARDSFSQVTLAWQMGRLYGWLRSDLD